MSLKTDLIVTTVPLVLFVLGVALNVLFRARTEAEYAALPRWQAVVVFTVRKACPDFGPIMAMIAQAILRQYTPPRPGVESLPPPPGADVDPVVLPKSAPVVILMPKDGGKDGPA